MRRVERLDNEAIYIKMANIVRIGNKAIAKAKAENKKLGLPETFWKAGKVYYVLPSGKITSERPEIMK